VAAYDFKETLIRCIKCSLLSVYYNLSLDVD